MKKQIIKKLIYRIAEVSFKAKEGHIPSALSILDILWVIYNNFININLIKNNSPKRDFFILSKGHGVLPFFVALHNAGFISQEVLYTYKKNESDLISHPVMNLELGIY